MPIITVSGPALEVERKRELAGALTQAASDAYRRQAGGRPSERLAIGPVEKVTPIDPSSAAGGLSVTTAAQPVILSAAKNLLPPRACHSERSEESVSPLHARLE